MLQFLSLLLFLLVVVGIICSKTFSLTQPVGHKPSDTPIPISINPKPSTRANRLPHGEFFSTAITVPSTSIHPMLPAPMVNIRSIKPQQHPTQNRP